MLSLVTYNKMLSQIKKLSLANKNKFSVEKIAKKIILLAMVYKGKYSYTGGERIDITLCFHLKRIF